MKKYLIGLLVALVAVLPCSAQNKPKPSPLAQYSNSWNDPKYKACNTAANVSYMSADEKEVIYILNLARTNPKLFCTTVVQAKDPISEYIDTSDKKYYGTLITTLNEMSPLQILQPDSMCTVSARCHAVSSGSKSYMGHNRQSAECKKKKHFMGECCNYGNSGPLETVFILLQDYEVESLGHREICLGNYTKIGVAIEKHNKYQLNAVLDFY